MSVTRASFRNPRAPASPAHRTAPFPEAPLGILDPIEQRLEVYRWHSDGYLQVLTAMRGERVRAEPFDAIELQVGVLFGDDDSDD